MQSSKNEPYFLQQKLAVDRKYIQLFVHYKETSLLYVENKPKYIFI